MVIATGITSGYAADITLSGTVYDGEFDNEPMIGVAVFATGTSKGINTDIDGKFTLTVPSGTSLRLTYTGYKTVTTDQYTSDNTNLTFTLQQDKVALEEVEAIQCTPNKELGIAATTYEVNTKKCMPTQCLSPRYKLEGTTTAQQTPGDNICIGDCDSYCYDDCPPITVGTQCVDQAGKECKKPKHATGAKLVATNDTTVVCQVTGCDAGYTESDDKTSCGLSSGDCSNIIRQDSDSHAISGKWENAKCIPTQCESERYKLADKKCVDQSGHECTPTAANATKGEYYWDGTNLICRVKDCAKNYLPNDARTACDLSEGPCPADELAKISNATAGELKNKICIPTACQTGYEISDNKCVQISGDCNPMPANAISASRQWNSERGVEECIINSCSSRYRVSDDKLSCVEITLSAEKQQEKIDELQKNADAMHEKEHSTANKLIGAAGIGMTGIGGMQLLSGKAEQSADQAAEQEMQAYLNTFRCDYGGGKTFRGGEREIELPGAGVLTEKYNEYITLASDLKARKESLGMMPGIESEEIIDSVTSGLYDDVGVGITDGVYTSISRALLDETGEDAAEWAKQKEDTASKVKTGIALAATGAAGSLIANMIVNKDAPKDQSAQINAKYELELLKEIRQTVVNNAKCGAGLIGTYPNCRCADSNTIKTEQGCETCPSGQRPDATGTDCECIDSTKKKYGDVCIEQNTCPNKNDALFDSTSKNCGCKNGYIQNNTICECPSTTHEVKNGQCIMKQTTKPIITLLGTNPVITPAQNPDKPQIETLSFPTSALFEGMGNKTLSQNAQNTIINTIKSKQAGKTYNNCTFVVTGHTDPYWNRSADSTTANTKNKELSLARAQSVTTALQNAFGAQKTYTFQSNGIGAEQCICGQSGEQNYSPQTATGACKGKSAGTHVTDHRAKYEPCRRVTIQVSCTAQTDTQKAINAFSSISSSTSKSSTPQGLDLSGLTNILGGQ